MKVKALTSFCGRVSMGQGDVKDIADKDLVKDLLQAGYVEEIREAAAPKKKAVKSSEDK